MTADVVLVVERTHGIPERARLAWRAVVRDRLANERETAARTGTGRQEEIAIPARRLGTGEPGGTDLVESLALCVVEERRRPAAAREHALLEPENEHSVEPARSRAAQIEDRHPPRLAGTSITYRDTLEGDEDLAPRGLGAGPRHRIELVQRTNDGVPGTEVGTRCAVPPKGAPIRGPSAPSSPRDA